MHLGSRLWSALALVLSLAVNVAVSADDSADAASEERAPAGEALDQKQALRVFLDCKAGCDREFLTRQVTYVNYVRDRRDSQVHVLVTRESNAAGRETTMSFIGQVDLSGMDQVVRFSTSTTDTDDEVRRKFKRYFELGLVRYVLQTPMADNLVVSYRPPENQRQVPVSPQDDPWNFWVFRASGDASASGEDRRKSRRYSGWFSASRTTEAWRNSMSVFASYLDREFELEDGELVQDTRRDNSASARFIKSLGEHWGLGFGASAREATFRNLDLGYRGAIAMQYNLFPYTESSERELTFTYFLGATDYSYIESTVFGLLEETRADQGFIVSLDTDRPWGESGADVELSHFLDDTSQYRVTLSGDVEYRIVRGLSLDLRLDAAWVSDQIYLPAESATDEEVLIGQRALATDFEFRLGVGISYTFGSIFNNVVNSRFRGASGGFSRIF